jgi:hypothetical protein
MTTTERGIGRDPGERTIEAITAWADASQKVLHELVSLSAATAAEGLRLHAELEAAGVDAARELRSQAAAETGAPWADPAGAWRQAADQALDGARRWLKLAEGQAGILGRSAERMQAGAGQAARHIQGAIEELTGRLVRLA